MTFNFATKISSLATLTLPPTAQWDQNGVTIAGAADGTSGSTFDRLNYNYGIYYTDDDILYIADSANSRIILIGPNSTTAIRVIWQVLPSRALQTPADVFVTRTSIYVIDASDFSVQKWSRDFSDSVIVAGTSGVKGNATDMMAFGSSYNIFVDKDDNVYVSDNENNRVMRFPWNSTNGTIGVIVAGTGVGGIEATQLNGPRGVFVTDDGTVYIADSYNHRIQKWPQNATVGTSVAGTGAGGTGLSELSYPQAVVVDQNGYIYIADSGNNRIMRWGPDAGDGECIVACSGVGGIGSNQLNEPNSIAFDWNGSLYVNDAGNRRVQKFAILNETGIEFLFVSNLIFDYLR